MCFSLCLCFLFLWIKMQGFHSKFISPFLLWSVRSLYFFRFCGPGTRVFRHFSIFFHLRFSQKQSMGFFFAFAGVCSFSWICAKFYWAPDFVEFVLGRFWHFSNCTFCGAWTPKFLWVHLKTVKISAKRAHPWNKIFIKVKSSNMLQFSLCFRRNWPITSIHTDFLLSSWKDSDVRFSSIGLKEFIYMDSLLSDLKKHPVTHFGTKWKCSQRPYETNDKRNLTSHVRKHTKVPSFICKFFPKLFVHSI